MTSAFSKKPPYWNTSVHYSRSKSDIEEMLKEFGAKAMRWTDTEASMKNQECPILEFIIQVELNGVQKQLGIRIQPPLLAEQKRRYGRYGERITTPNLNASMRLLYWYMKARMEAVLFGLDDVVETFMSKIMHTLPDGSSSTFGKTIKENPQFLTQILPSFEIRQPQLESRVIETESEK